jgi:hypothetical protein
MDMLNAFRVALDESHQEDPEQLPASLSRACVQVLPIAGAGICLTGDLRVPLGSSDDVAARAEQLQSTLGEGPCLTAAAAAEPLGAGLQRMAVDWPVFHREFTSQTPYRSVVSLPLLARDGITGLGALDLYLTSPESPSDLFVSQVTAAIAAPISSILFEHDGIAANPNAVPAWLHNPQLTQRLHVWVAVAILMEHCGVDDDDALAALRAYAFAHDETIDGTAGLLMSQELRPDMVLDTDDRLAGAVPV